MPNTLTAETAVQDEVQLPEIDASNLVFDHATGIMPKASASSIIRALAQ